MALNINGTTGISGVDGSASAPALQGTDSNTGINFASDTVNINTGGATRATVDSSGRLGIGLTNPTGKFAVSDGSVVGEINPNGGICYIGTRSNHPITFLTNASGIMTLDSSGNLLVGTSSTSNGASGTKVESSGQKLVNIRNSTNTNVFLNKVGVNGTFMTFSKDSSTKGTITTNGTSTAYNISSDYRLKENETLISDGITRLKTLKPYRFNWKSNPAETVDGFFAHEVTAVPEAIWGEKDAVEPEDNEENEIKKGDPIYQQIDQSKLVPLLTAALQEAIAKIEVLETKVAALEAG